MVRWEQVAGACERREAVSIVAVREAVAEEILWDLPGGPLRLGRVANLAQYVNREALLRDDDAPEPPYWAHLWPAAMSLARLVLQAGPALRGRRVIELGCGLGLPGLVAAWCGATVLFTDRSPDALRFTRRNVERNGLAADVVLMDWRQVAVRSEFDLCLAADVTYDPQANRALLGFLDRHLARDGAVWIAESVRAEERGVPDLLRRRFAVREQRMAETEEGHRVWVRVLQGRWPR